MEIVYGYVILLELCIFAIKILPILQYVIDIFDHLT